MNQLIDAPSPIFIGNQSSKELHALSCKWIRHMAERNKVPFYALGPAAEEGYDGCGHCLKGYNGRLATHYQSTPDLEAVLENKPQLADLIVWETADGPRTYPGWPSAAKQQLIEAFELALDGKSIPLLDPPPNLAESLDDDYPLTVLSEDHAWPLYLAHIAQSLAFDFDDWVTFSLADMPPEEAAVILDSREMFVWSESDGGYALQFSVGHVLPGPPADVSAFFHDNNLIGVNRLDTICRLVDWCRLNLTHFSGGYKTGNCENHWHYRGAPPISRIINGTIRNSVHDAGIVKHFTAGCTGTLGYLRSVLRVVNIPVEGRWHGDSRDKHTLVRFPTEERYLSHGDDPYNQLSHATPPYPAEHLLIDLETYQSWFGKGVSGEEQLNNVGRGVREMALQVLPDRLLEYRCEDISIGRSRNMSDVFDVFSRNYTLAELEAMHLWERIDEMIASFGGCEFLSERST